MNLIELKNIIDKEVENGFGNIPVLLKNKDNEYEEIDGIEFDPNEAGYTIY